MSLETDPEWQALERKYRALERDADRLRRMLAGREEPFRWNATETTLTRHANAVAEQLASSAVTSLRQALKIVEADMILVSAEQCRLEETDEAEHVRMLRFTMPVGAANDAAVTPGGAA